jgi:hypothetical protein
MHDALHGTVEAMTPMRHGGGCQHQYCLHHFDAELNLDPPFYFNPDPDPALHFNAEVDSEPIFHIDVWAHFEPPSPPWLHCKPPKFLREPVSQC